MKINPPVKRSMVLGQQIQEPTLLAMALTIIGFAVLLAVCVVAIAGLPAFGYIWWTFVAVGAILAYLVVGFRRKPLSGSPTGRQRWFGRIRGWARLLFIAVLTCWPG